MMKMVAMTGRLALLAIAGMAWHSLGANLAMDRAIAAQFDQMPVNSDRFVVLAAPIGRGESHKLVIVEQLSDAQPCWRDRPGNATEVDPLFTEFDFTNICGVGKDSNDYSLRVGGEDLNWRYSLRIVRDRGDLVLLAFSNQNRSTPDLEVGRSQGMTNGFARIRLNPGWQLSRRSFEGQPTGHLYLTNEQPLSSLLPATATPATQSPAPSVNRPSPSGQPAAITVPTVTEPIQIPVPPPETPQLKTVVPGGSPAPTTGVVVPTVSVIPASPLPASPLPASPAAPPPPAAPDPAAALPSLRLPVPAVPPLIAATQSPPSSIPVFSGEQLPAPPADLTDPAGFNFRLIVPADTPEVQAQVQQIVPDAFPRMMNGQSVIQAGLFRDRATAEIVQQRLTQQNLPAMVIPVTFGSSGLPMPTPSLPSGTAISGFSLPQPTDSLLRRPTALWATYYYLHRAQTVGRGNPLLDPMGRSLGVELSDRDWCDAALQGSVQIADGANVVGTFNYAGRGGQMQVDCSRYFPRLSTVAATSRSRFKRSDTPFGEGVSGYQLVPYRTVAVDREMIPIGSVLYIPAARGVTVTLPDGQQVVHDGYFYAADVGGAIGGNHIDVFLGPTRDNPFQFVQSTASATFQAYLVTDSQIQNQLASLHRASSRTASIQP